MQQHACKRQQEMKSVGNNFNKLSHMYFLSYMEFRLFVFFTCWNVCVRSCLILLLLCRSGYDWFYFSFLSCAIAKSGLCSYVCCSVINFLDRWYSCIYFCSQKFMWLPLLHCFSSFNVVTHRRSFRSLNNTNVLMCCL